MGKIILTAFMKLPLMFKGLSVAFISMLEAMVRSIDDIGYLILNPLRTIRFQEVRAVSYTHLTLPTKRIV